MTSANTNSPHQHKYDHVVVVVLENHGYDEIIPQSDSTGANNAPYINGTLAKDGILITNAYGEQHPSQPNYFWLFSGSNQGITYDTPYWDQHGLPPGPVFHAPNLYHALENTVGGDQFFGGYVDSGNQNNVANYYQDTANYANRHVPWLGFKNINNGNPAGITRNFGTEFPIPTGENPEPAYDLLPSVSFVIPALNHDMHDYDDYRHAVHNTHTSAIAISKGDLWLANNLHGYAEWAKNNNSLLIITFDEDSSADWPLPSNPSSKDKGKKPSGKDKGKNPGGNGKGKKPGYNPYGLTAPKLPFTPGEPGAKGTSGPNQIAMIFYGANLKTSGPVTIPGAGVNNVNLLRTIESFFGLPKSGKQTPLAMAAGLTDGPIEGIFTFND